MTTDLEEVARNYRDCRVDPFVRDAIEEAITPLGLTFGTLDDLISDIRRYEPEAHLRATDTGRTISSPKARTAVLRLRTRGFSPRAISDLTWHGDGPVLPVETVEWFFRHHDMTVDEPQVVKEHLMGRTPQQISKFHGWPRASIHDVIVRAGFTPNVHLRRVPADIRNRVLELRNTGAKQDAIRAATGLSNSQIKSVLRWGAKKGLVRDYGERASA